LKVGGMVGMCQDLLSEGEGKGPMPTSMKEVSSGKGLRGKEKIAMFGLLDKEKGHTVARGRWGEGL